MSAPDLLEAAKILAKGVKDGGYPYLEGSEIGSDAGRVLAAIEAEELKREHDTMVREMVRKLMDAAIRVDQLGDGASLADLRVAIARLKELGVI